MSTVSLRSEAPMGAEFAPWRHRVFATIESRYCVASKRPGRGAQPIPIQPCRTRCLSVEGLDVVSGTVSRTVGGGFVLQNELSEESGAKLERRLVWLKRHHEEGLDNQRQAKRMLAPRKSVEVTGSDGVTRAASLLDLSRSGVGVTAEWRPERGAAVLVAGFEAVVVRHTEAGFAMQFKSMQSAGIFEQLFGMVADEMDCGDEPISA